MMKPRRSNHKKQANRPHYIEAWAEHRGLAKQADLVRALGADKSLVSRWYAGSTPDRHWLEQMAELFHVEIESLFRHPDDDWFARFFRERSEEDRERAREILEAAFPRRTGTDN